MDKCASLCVGRKVTCRCVLETLDNGRLSTPIVADDDCQGTEELDHVDRLVVKGPDAAHGHLFSPCQLQWRVRSPVEASLTVERRHCGDTWTLAWMVAKDNDQ